MYIFFNPYGPLSEIKDYYYYYSTVLVGKCEENMYYRETQN